MNAPADPIQAFCDSHHEYNQIGAARRIAQERTLRNFEAHIGRPILELQADDLREWAEGLSATGLHPNTVRFKIQLIRPFATWAWERGLLDADRLLAIRAVKPPRGASANGVPRPYTRKELTVFWDELRADYPHGAPSRGRVGDEAGVYWLNRWLRGTSPFRRAAPYLRRAQIEAVAALALYGGLRMSEVFDLRLDDLDPENEYMVVRGAAKNAQGISRDRAVPWLPQSRAAVSHWLACRQRIASVKGIDHEQVWLTLYGPWATEPMQMRRFCMLMRRIGSGWEYHRLRHTFATEALRSGMELEVLSRILGHASLQQTMGYAQLVQSDLVAAAARVEDKLGKALGGSP